MGERIIKKCAWLICVICIVGSGVAPDDAYAQSTGNIVSWGRQVVVEPSDLGDLVAVAGGSYHSLGIRRDCNSNGFSDYAEIVGHPSLDWNNDGIIDSCQPGTSDIPSGDTKQFALYDAHPNPFNPQTTISFDLPRQTSVGLRVCDVSGRLVNVLLENEIADQGRNEVVWQGRDMVGWVVSAGVYFYRLEAGEYTETKRMTLLK